MYGSTAVKLVWVQVSVLENLEMFANEHLICETIWLHINVNMYVNVSAAELLWVSMSVLENVEIFVITLQRF